MILGLDIGTSSTKAVAFDLEGNVLATHSISYPILNPLKGHYEQDPEVIYRACIASVANVMIELQDHNMMLPPIGQQIKIRFHNDSTEYNKICKVKNGINDRVCRKSRSSQIARVLFYKAPTRNLSRISEIR